MQVLLINCICFFRVNKEISIMKNYKSIDGFILFYSSTSSSLLSKYSLQSQSNFSPFKHFP